MAFELSAEPRTGAGRSLSRRLRRTGRVPAIVYGGGETPSAISLDHNKLLHQMGHEAFYTSILTLKVEKLEQAVVVKAVQRHPAKPEILHLDFQRIVADVEITMHVPIHFVGEAVAVGVKEQGGVIEHLLTDVEITCLPKDLPEFLELDVTKVELNQILHLSDLPLPEGVTSTALEHGHDHPVVAINPPRREEEEAPVAAAETAAGEVPATAQAEPAKAEGGDAEAKGKGKG